MTNRPRRARARRASETEPSWGERTNARLQWVLANLASLEAPVWQVMMVLIKYADETGRSFPALQTIGDSLRLALVDVEEALADAEALDLIRPAGLSEYDTPTWILQEGQHLPDPLPLFSRAVTDKVRVLLRHIGPLEYILLEAMIDVGYKWMDNTMHTTSKQLRDRLPGLGESQLRDCLHRLCSTPYVTRLKQGYGNRPSIFQLELSAVAEAARSSPATARRITPTPDNLNRENLSGHKKAVSQKLPGDNKVDVQKLTGDNNSGNAPIKEPTILKPTTDMSSSSSRLTTTPSGGDDDDDTDREKFLSTLGQAFHETIPGAPGVWRRSYATSALTITRPFRARFGCYPSDDEVVDLLNRCAAYAARTWAYVAHALSDWVDEQVDTREPPMPTPSDRHRVYTPHLSDERARQTWGNALEIIRPTVTAPLYDTCLSKTTGLLWADGVFTLEAPSQAVATLIEDRLYTMIAATLQELLESPVDVAIQLPASHRLGGEETP